MDELRQAMRRMNALLQGIVDLGLLASGRFIWRARREQPTGTFGLGVTCARCGEFTESEVLSASPGMNGLASQMDRMRLLMRGRHQNHSRWGCEGLACLVAPFPPEVETAWALNLLENPA